MIVTKLMLFATVILAFALERGTAIELHYPIRRPHAEPDVAARVMSSKEKRIAMDALRMRRKLENEMVDSYSYEVVEICKSGKSGSGKSDNGKSGSSTGKSGGGKSGSGKSDNGKSGSSTGKSGGSSTGTIASSTGTIAGSSTGTGAGRRRRRQELEAGCIEDDDFTPSYEDDDYYSKPVPAPPTDPLTPVGPPTFPLTEREDDEPTPAPTMDPYKPVPAPPTDPLTPVGPPTFPLTEREDDEPTPAPTMDPYDTRSNDSVDKPGDGCRRKLEAGCIEDDDYYAPVPAPPTDPLSPVGPPLTGREDDEPTPAPTMDPYDTRSNDSIDLPGDAPTVTPLSVDGPSGSNSEMDRDYHPPGGAIPGLGEGFLPPPPPIGASPPLPEKVPSNDDSE